MTDRSGKEGYSIKAYIPDNYSWVPFIRELIDIEDRRFQYHFWVDVLAKMRALIDNILGEPVSGWSTITEQYIKIKYFQDYPRSFFQKIREAIIAFTFSIFYDKKTIIENYLNSVYMGNRIYSVHAAARIYFHKDNFGVLNEEERTILITLIHNPGLSLDDVKFQNYFSEVKNRLGFTFESQIHSLEKIQNIDYFPFVSRKAEDLCSQNNQEENWILFIQADCTKGEFRTTIDAQLSLFARNSLNQTLTQLHKKHVTNGAIFWLNPLTKEILIYEWSRDFYSQSIDGQVDVITSPRQPGSSMKPFLYLLALKNNFHPNSVILDLERQYPSFQPGLTYTSENYTLKEYGLVRFKKALWNSLNNASVRLAQELWINRVYDFYKQNGFHFDFPAEHYWYSLVLGNPTIRLYDLVMSYIRLVPTPDKDGYIDEDKYLLMDILKNPDNRDISFGVNSLLNTSIPQAVKTGTSSDFRDNTIVSYSPDMVLWIWVWNNDNSSMLGVTGVTGAAPVWHNVIEESIRRGYIRDLEIKMPESLQKTPYCLDSDCYRQEISIQKLWSRFYSRISDSIYDARDIPETLQKSEIKRLEELGFRIQ